LWEEGMAYCNGYDHQTIDTPRGRLLLQASRDAGCKTALAMDLMAAPNLSDEGKQKVLKVLKEIGTSSPYNWVYYCIGMGYQRGFGGEEKKNQAVVWYLQAINGGNASAMSTLGVAYQMGNLGLTQSFTKMNELYALAVEKGHSAAQYNLGYMYAKGEGTLLIQRKQLPTL
jgi:hypothetical protein